MKEVQQKIIIIDDDVELLETIDFLLSCEGYKTITVTNAYDALKTLPEFVPDLIITDLIMTGMDGIILIRKVREDEQFRATPIIILTGKDDHKEMIRALEIGADDYIVKPFNNQEFLARVKAVLRLRTLYKLLSEKEKKEAQFELLSQVMLTLAHYINNSLQVIQSVITILDTSDPKNIEKIKKTILDSSKKIQAVLKSIEKISKDMEFKISEVFPGITMIDIEEQVKNFIKQE